jgi:hypothetical protein
MYLLELAWDAEKNIRNILKIYLRNSYLFDLTKNISFCKSKYRFTRILIDVDLADEVINKLAYTRWNIFGKATIALNPCLFFMSKYEQHLPYVLVHELLHVKKGYWKSWLLLFFRKRIEKQINEEVDLLMKRYYNI